MKKRFGAVLVAGVMSCSMAVGLAFAGCASTQKAEFVMPEGGFNTEKTVTIKFYHTQGDALNGVMKRHIEAFNELFPNIVVEDEQVGGYDDVRNQISNEIMAGDQPNVAYCYPDHVAAYNKSGAVLPLNDFLPGGKYANMTVKQADGTEISLNMTEDEKKMFIEGYYNEGYKFDDETTMYTLPFSKSTEVLYYNKTKFDEWGLKAPTTWDEMETVCKTIKEKEPTSVPLGYDSEANWFITMCEQYGSPYTSSMGEFLFDNEKNQEFVTRFKGWYDKGYVTTQAIYGAYTSGLFTATTGQRCYMCIGSSAGASHQTPTPTTGANGKVYPFTVDITTIPQVHPENPKVISQGPSVCIFKSNDPQEVLASWLLVRYLTTSIGFQAEFGDASGYVPVLKQEYIMTNATYAGKLEKRNGTDNLTYLSAWVCMQQQDAYYTSPAFIGSSDARTQVGLLMQAALTGSKSVDTAFKDAIAECEYKVS